MGRGVRVVAVSVRLGVPVPIVVVEVRVLVHRAVAVVVDVVGLLGGAGVDRRIVVRTVAFGLHVPIAVPVDLEALPEPGHRDPVVLQVDQAQVGGHVEGQVQGRGVGHGAVVLVDAAVVPVVVGRLGLGLALGQVGPHAPGSGGVHVVPVVVVDVPGAHVADPDGDVVGVQLQPDLVVAARIARFVAPAQVGELDVLIRDRHLVGRVRVVLGGEHLVGQADLGDQPAGAARVLVEPALHGRGEEREGVAQQQAQGLVRPGGATRDLGVPVRDLRVPLPEGGLPDPLLLHPPRQGLALLSGQLELRSQRFQPPLLPEDHPDQRLGPKRLLEAELRSTGGRDQRGERRRDQQSRKRCAHARDNTSSTRPREDKLRLTVRPPRGGEIPCYRVPGS